jgi:hypothetical protein
MIQVALASVVILGFSALAIDYGVLLVARAQAQNAADAGALAAATTLAFDTMADLEFDRAQQSAVAVASTVPVWGQPAGVELPEICDLVSSPSDPLVAGLCPMLGEFPPLPARTGIGATVRVNRNGNFGSARLPTYFARLFGVNAQDVRAQATAVVVPANTSTCVWPVAIPDFWFDNVPDSKYVARQFLGEPMVTLADVYAGPPTYEDGSFVSGSLSPTGIVVSTTTPPSDSLVYDPLTLTDFLAPVAGLWPPAEDATNVAGGRPVAVVIPRGDGGGFVENLTSCNQVPLHVGDALVLENSVTFTQVVTAASAKSAEDGGANWDAGIRRIRGSCAGTPTCPAISPRLVVLPVFDPDRYDATRDSIPVISIVNFVGFFIADAAGPAIIGNLSTYPGTVDFESPFVQLDNSPLRTVVLAR